MIDLEQGARDEALHAKVDALRAELLHELRAELGALHELLRRAELGVLREKLDAVPILIESLFAAVYEKLDAVPRLLRSLFTAGREKLEAARGGRGGREKPRHHGAGPTDNAIKNTNAAWSEAENTNAAWRSGGDAVQSLLNL